MVKDKAYMEDRPVQDGEAVTACAQACPTSAIVFGDTMDESSLVSKLWKKHQVERGVYQKTKNAKKNADLRGYRIFEELNVDPSVMYLERVREDI